MIDEEVRGWRSPPASVVRGRGWGRHHSLSGLEEGGGSGIKRVRDFEGEGLSKRPSALL